MSELTILPVATRRQQRQFLALPWTLYRDDPNWVPPLRGEERQLVGFGHHPFYENNESQAFLAFRDGEVCGRIVAILNRTHIEYRKEQRGFFGFFECADDQQTANGLLDAARGWLAGHGIQCLRGPANPSINYVLGMLVGPFDSPPTFMMAYNPPYYPRLLESYGLHKAQDLYAFYGHLDMLPKSAAKVDPIADQIIEHFGVKLRGLDKSNFLADVEEFLSIYNRSLVQHWGFSPMSGGEVRHMAKGLKHLLVPELTSATEIDGRVVGAVLCLPDYNPVIKRIDGRLFPFGFIRLLRSKRRIKKVRVVSANVLPEYQRMGLGLVLVRSLVPMGLAFGLTEVEYSWVAESNRLSRGGLEKGGAKRVKTYRVYDWDP